MMDFFGSFGTFPPVIISTLHIQTCVLSYLTSMSPESTDKLNRRTLGGKRLVSPNQCNSKPQRHSSFCI